MCCFSVSSSGSRLKRWLFPPKVRVSRTSIFARLREPGEQVLAYGMNLETSRAVAMVLPLPVRLGSGEDAVRFLDLSEHPKMFRELAELFESPELESQWRGGRSLGIQPKLVVHDVGQFIASYVPTRADFARLDARFRLPEVLFDAVPHYADYGFAVFQLKRGKVTVHPMAFSFPTRAPEQLFFPTVHVHDGSFHELADFDHTLYYQHPGCSAPDPLRPLFPFQEDHASSTLADLTYEGLVDNRRPLVRRVLAGRLPNRDTWVAAS